MCYKMLHIIHVYVPTCTAPVEWVYTKQQPVSNSAWSHELYCRTCAHTDDITEIRVNFMQILRFASCENLRLSISD